MKINKLKLRGAIGIWKGLGKEEIEIDFSNFGTGLIALTGKNGSGKTTIMENLHPYRCMVSRTGSLQSHFFLKDSYRFLEFEHNGDRYESKILIDALTGASEAYLLKNGHQPMTDGKLTTYDEAIESVLGSQELFFNSVFSGQKSKGIAELKPSERRKLFYELLSLDVYENHLEKAKAKLKENELKLSEIEGKISTLEGKSELRERLEEELKRLTSDKAILKNSHRAIIDNIEDVRNEIKVAEISKAKLEERKAKNVEIEKRLESIGNEIDELAKTTNERTSKLQLRIEENESRIEEKQLLSSRKKEIEEKTKAVAELELSLQAEKNESEKAQSLFNKIQTRLMSAKDDILNKSEKLNEIYGKRSSVLKNIERYEAEIKRSEKNVAIIDDVPCDEATGASCQFLKNAFESKKSIPQLKGELTALKEKYDSLDAEYCDIEDEINEENKKSKKLHHETVVLQSHITEIENNISEIEGKINELNPEEIASQKEEIKTAEQDINLLTAEKKHLEELIDEARRSFDERLNALKKEAGELQNNLRLSVNKEIEDVKKSIGIFEDNLSRLENELKKINEAISDNDFAIASISERLDSIKDDEAKLAKLIFDKSTVQKKIQDWTFLAKAFDKTGIPVLKLENSGVQITAIANELLSLFENQFRIVFETTQLTKDKKKLKETFNINVISGDDVVEISNLSGGQQVWVETAIQLAISLLVREQGINIETSFLDEKDGALDIENAHLYLEMLKLAHRKSGVHHTFVITHRPELIDLIPQKITLGNGYLQTLNEVA